MVAVDVVELLAGRLHQHLRKHVLFVFTLAQQSLPLFRVLGFGVVFPYLGQIGHLDPAGTPRSAVVRITEVRVVLR